MNRFFNRQQKQAAAIYQDVDIDGMDADHIKPFSAGGATDESNIRMIPPAVNRAKGSNEVTLRAWQNEFFRALEKHQETSFLCVAVPGAGKTFASLYAARRFLDAGSDRRIIIVVPTDNLRAQWCHEAGRFFGIHLQTGEFGANFKSGFIGGVTTYQSLESLAPIFRVLCSRVPTLVILDEPHHCGDKSSWGGNVKVAFEMAAKRLLLSGTPFRTDGTPIPFIKYDGGGICLPDYRYDYPDALTDSVVRYFTFDYSKGAYDEIYQGEKRRMEFHGGISDEEASERLRSILNASGDFAAEQIRIAHEKLIEIRRAIPDAGAMAVCIDQIHAQQIAKVIKRVTGCEPSVIVSDETAANDSVKAFRASRKEWLVSVRMVSEGTDIKRLQVLCYLTNATTEIFFRQLIGRVCRVRYQEKAQAPTDDAGTIDLEAFVFLPADPRLIEHAKNIEAAQLRALRDSDPDPRPEKDDSEKQEKPDRIFCGSDHEGTDRVIIAGREYCGRDAVAINELLAMGMPSEKVAAFYQWHTSNASLHESPAPSDPSFETKEEKLKKLRKTANSRAFHLSKIIDCDPKEIHGLYKRHGEMSIEEVSAKIEDLERRIAKEQAR